ncbi:hypothetical protein J31TS4_22040 [Paenibacillus sp. J31TS4]|uniref:DUF4383 domain-containing protein n=1 Tax=Paenibacillus sp. J31TS4 TaxID=2807195 RepID=UPI001B00E57F|nr:DUF4383 domain-containing protein [Paenibacillus sp. J31TS4]GIP38924.1 hypothetical protein J31TS4_22040 [Paenibacillus sp. J31TS4]
MVRAFARWSGVVFLLLGTIGFFVHHLFGLFHFDTVHNVIHLLIGAWGLWAGTREPSAVLYAKLVGIIYLILGSLGFFSPGAFGMMELEMAENLLHLFVGALGTYLGFVYAESRTNSGSPRPRRAA